MRVMVFGKAREEMAAGMAPTPELLEAFAAMDAYTEELVKAGVFVAAAGLRNDTSAKRVLFDGASHIVVDGPFAFNHNLVAGFSIWEVKDIDEAVAWARRSPQVMAGKGEIEIRPFYEPEDLGGLVSPEESAAPHSGDRGKLGVA